MAHTYRNLWPQVTAWENLLLAYARCRRRKRFKREAAAFHFRWETELLTLQRELIAGDWRPGPYHNFRIRDPKPRLISAAPFRDRVVHHAVVNVLEPLYERRFLHDSYACRRGKGTHRAVRRAQFYLRRHPYFLKTDIVRYFPNVDHAVLLGLLRRTLQDPELDRLISLIVASGEGVLAAEASQHWFPGDDLLAVLRPRGLPIGNLTSQFFANVLLDVIDHEVKEGIRVPGYVRYADDLVLFADSKRQLWGYRDRLADALRRLRLRLHADKTMVRPARHGLNFLGFRILPDARRLQQRTIARFNRCRRRLQHDYGRRRIGPDDARRSLTAWLGHCRHANTDGIQRALWRRVRFRRDHSTLSPAGQR